MKFIVKYFIALLTITAGIGIPTAVLAQQVQVQSPNNNISVELLCDGECTTGNWYLSVSKADAEETVLIPRIDLGLIRSNQDFTNDLTFLKAGEQTTITDEYTAVHGKSKERKNTAHEVVAQFENADKARINLNIRAYNDGLAFRYEFPERSGSYKVMDELTAYHIPDSTKRWLQPWNPANERIYDEMLDGSVQRDWGIPALFNTKDTDFWYLIHEGDLGRDYAGTKLRNENDGNVYKLAFPDSGDARGTGIPEPEIELPWKSPWRIVIVGDLETIVESTLVQDVSEPSKIENTDWIKPGIASWNYWSHNHGTKDYQVVKKFADLAAEMGWPYTLLDWEWDAMSNGGDLEDAAAYIDSLGVKPWIWYNSGGDHNWVPATPKDRMLTHENRVETFNKIKEMGFVGVKVDFFESEKQHMINYYLDILEDAADFEIMVNFHGSIVPRGWARTYPNFMSTEAVRGAEWYNNTPELTTTAPPHNTTLPFTRNVVGPMDYTPVTFTNSQNPHITSYGHELALSVVFESAIQHFADRPEGYYRLPDAPRSFLKDVPVAWDETCFVDGYPGKLAVLARKKGENWYVGGIHSDSRDINYTLNFDFLPEGQEYKLTLISDGEHDTAFNTRYLVVDQSSTVDFFLLRRGGFAAKLELYND
ncbi:MAG: alpha-glucosidase [Balneola sp.]|nr:alpha-glucosidase [Balneola sp.]|tara:strand:- start:56626 stop:58572 length:1947 start_codon:yes stop_codon:yes gene_type:complete